jgi:hypothetical protein
MVACTGSPDKNRRRTMAVAPEASTSSQHEALQGAATVVYALTRGETAKALESRTFKASVR